MTTQTEPEKTTEQRQEQRIPKQWVIPRVPDLLTLSTAHFMRDAKGLPLMSLELPIQDSNTFGFNYGNASIKLKLVSYNSQGYWGFRGIASIVESSGRVGALDMEVIGEFSMEVKTGIIQEFFPELPGQLWRFIL